MKKMALVRRVAVMVAAAVLGGTAQAQAQTQEVVAINQAAPTPGAEPIAQPSLFVEQGPLGLTMSLRAQQFAPGLLPVMRMVRSAMGQGQRQFVVIHAQPGRCYRILGVGGAGVIDLDLRVRDQSGAVLDQGVATDNVPVLGLQRLLCTAWSGDLQVEALMYGGSGDFALQAFATN